MFYTYILYSTNFNRYYIGQCEDVNIRLNRHNNKGVPSTKPFIPWTLVYTEIFSSRAEKVAREKEIKDKKSRKYIEWLIVSNKTN